MNTDKFSTASWIKDERQFSLCDNDRKLSWASCVVHTTQSSTQWVSPLRRTFRGRFGVKLLFQILSKLSNYYHKPEFTVFPPHVHYFSFFSGFFTRNLVLSYFNLFLDFSSIFPHQLLCCWKVGNLIPRETFCRICFMLIITFQIPKTQIFCANITRGFVPTFQTPKQIDFMRYCLFSPISEKFIILKSSKKDESPSL